MIMEVGNEFIDVIPFWEIYVLLQYLIKKLQIIYSVFLYFLNTRLSNKKIFRC